MLKRGKPADRGFSLPEVLVATTMIGATVAVMASLLTQSTQAQALMDAQQTVNNVLQAEVAAVHAAPWYDVMLRPTGAGATSVCELTGRLLQTSAQSVRPSDRAIIDRVVIDITRDVRWLSSGTQVTCANTPNDRDDVKVVTLTMRWWPDSVQQRTRVMTLYLSRYTGVLGSTQ